MAASTSEIRNLSARACLNYRLNIDLGPMEAQTLQEILLSVINVHLT